MSQRTENPKHLAGSSKVPFSVVPAGVVAEVSVGMLEGALKYDRHNYREAGALASDYYDATQRHLMAWWEGEDIDAPSGLSHITKAIASLIVLRDTMLHGTFKDDRPPASPIPFDHLNHLCAVLRERYADKAQTPVTNKVL